MTMQDGQDEIYAQAIQDSNRRLVVLKTLSNFFNHKDLFAVYVRTKVIHNLFEANKSLDVNKLELFHIQYTSSLIELFQKLKKGKEQQYMLVTDEIYINEELIAKLQKEAGTEDFDTERKKYGQAMGTKLRELYNLLSETVTGTFSWGSVLMFSTRYGKEFYRELTDANLFLALTETEGKNAYHSDYGTIERKLMGRLNKLNFRIKFVCGFQFDTEFIEVFDFVDSNDRFIFINSIRSFFLLDKTLENQLDLSRNTSSRQEIIAGLKHKNEMLTEKLATIKTALPNDVEEVLASYLEKISGVDFIEELQNVDEQTNILRAMLNININSK